MQGIESGGVDTWANGNGFYQKCFSGSEQAAIMTTVKNTEAMETMNNARYALALKDLDANTTSKIQWYNYSSGGDYFALGCPLRGDTIFLLSAKEATNPDYGFSNATTSNDSTYTYTADNNRKCKQNAASGTASWWWLRSAYCDGVAVVGVGGAGDGHYSNNSGGAVRCALNLQLSSVIYSSEAGAVSSYGFNAVSATAPCAVAISHAGIPSGKTEAQIASKLTLNDPSRTNNFTATSTSDTNEVSGVAYGTIRIKYSGATTDEGGTEHISAIIKDDTNGVYYQGRFKTLTGETGYGSNGTVDLTLPSDIPVGQLPRP